MTDLNCVAPVLQGGNQTVPLRRLVCPAEKRPLQTGGSLAAPFSFPEITERVTQLMPRLSHEPRKGRKS